jgi:hypothetical protein
VGLHRMGFHVTVRSMNDVVPCRPACTTGRMALCCTPGVLGRQPPPKPAATQPTGTVVVSASKRWISKRPMPPEENAATSSTQAVSVPSVPAASFW